MSAQHPQIVMVTGPLVGVGAVEPTAECLRSSGCDVIVPDALSADHDCPAWRDWPQRVADLLSCDAAPIVIGYSAATHIVAKMTSLLAIRALVMIDGDIPPRNGPVPPARGAFRELINTLSDEHGGLPPWSDWWRTERHVEHIGITLLSRVPGALESFRTQCPRVDLRWMDDAIELPSWDYVPAAYIQTSTFFRASGDEAERAGWPVVRIEGTHLHPLLAPQETAAAIQHVIERLMM